jgi:hypothetical protein
MSALGKQKYYPFKKFGQAIDPAPLSIKSLLNILGYLVKQ